MRVSRRIAWAGTIGACLVAGCLVPDPPGDLPARASRPPRILRDDAKPPPSIVMGRLESAATLVVPVEVLDTQAKLVWRLFVDFDPELSGAAVLDGVVDADQAQSTVRTVAVQISGLVDPGACHNFRLVVAFDFQARSPWTPASPGGDSADWFYRPGGQVAACPGYDAGTFPDASADAGAD